MGAKASVAAKQNDQAAAIAKVREDHAKIEAEDEAERKKNMAKYRATATIEAKLRIKADKARLEAEKKRREEAEAEASKEKEQEEADRVSRLKRRNTRHQIMQLKAEKNEISADTAAKLQVRKKSTTQAIFSDQPAAAEWGAGKSKIWLALNPQPIAHQTAADRRERETKVDVGVIGAKNYTHMQQVMATPEDGPVASPVKAGGAGVDMPPADDEHDSDDLAEEVEDSDEEESEAEVDEAELDELDGEFEQMLNKNRAQRDEEEKARKAALAAEWKAEQDKIKEERDKELAIIAARKKLDDEEKQRKRDEVVKESQARMEKELDFSEFNFNFG